MTKAEWRLEHEKYLKTDKWKLIRDKVLARDKETCQKCGGCGWHVHHLTYARWRNERLEDLLTLCDSCHYLEHFTRNKRKRKKNSFARHKPPGKSQKINRKDVNSFIERILKSKEYVRFDKAARKLLLPHPMEILNHFEFRGNTYQEKFNDITQKWFNKLDLVEKLRTMDAVFDAYYARKAAKPI